MAMTMIKHDDVQRAPILKDDGEIASLVSYVKGIASTPLKGTVDREAERLDKSGLFSAVEARMPKVFQTPAKSIFSWWKTPVPELVPNPLSVPGTLRGLFTKASDLTQNAILSQVVIAPQSAIESPEIEALKETKTISKPYLFNAGHGEIYPEGFIKLGFMQAHISERDSFYDNTHISNPNYIPLRKPVGTVSIPVMGLDTDMMKAVSAHHPEKMLRALQDMMTSANHDFVHHMINVDANIEISHRVKNSDTMDEIKEQIGTYIGKRHENHPLGYESWANVFHAATVRQMGQPFEVEMKRNVDIFFDELERISAELKQDPNITPDQRRKIVDYFSISSGFVLVRVAPLDSPLAQHMLDRMQKAETQPEIPLKLMTKEYERELLEVTNMYAEAGHRLIGDDEKPVSWKAARELQLIALLPNVTIMLAPARPGNPVRTAWDRGPEMDAALLSTLAKPGVS